MNYIAALFIGVVVYALVDLVLSAIPKLSSKAELLALAAGGLGGLLFLGVLH